MFYLLMQFIRGAVYEGIKVYKTMYQSRPGPLSNLTAMLRHNMAGILEVEEFRTLSGQSSVSLGLSTHNFIRLRPSS